MEKSTIGITIATAIINLVMSGEKNSKFNLKNAYFKATNKFSEVGSFSIEFTKMNYLAQQPGGLTDNNLILIQTLL